MLEWPTAPPYAEAEGKGRTNNALLRKDQQWQGLFAE